MIGIGVPSLGATVTGARFDWAGMAGVPLLEDVSAGRSFD